jgi:hypothetical protein
MEKEREMRTAYAVSTDPQIERRVTGMAMPSVCSAVIVPVASSSSQGMRPASS